MHLEDVLQRNAALVNTRKHRARTFHGASGQVSRTRRPVRLRCRATTLWKHEMKLLNPSKVSYKRAA